MDGAGEIFVDLKKMIIFAVVNKVEWGSRPMKMIRFSNGCSGIVACSAYGSGFLLPVGFGEKRIGKFGIIDIPLWPAMRSQR